MKKIILSIAIIIGFINNLSSQKKEIVIEIFQNNEKCYCTNVKINVGAKIFKADKNAIIRIDSDLTHEGDIVIQVNNKSFTFSNLKFESKGVGNKWKILFDYPQKVDNTKYTKYTYAFIPGNGAQITEERFGTVPPIKCKSQK
jgi:hypothetical protein